MLLFETMVTMGKGPMGLAIPCTLMDLSLSAQEKCVVVGHDMKMIRE